MEEFEMDEIEIREKSIEELAQYIKDNGIDKKTRKQNVLFKRQYLTAYATKTLGMNLGDAGRLFGMWEDKYAVDHFHTRSHNYLKKYERDKSWVRFKDYIAHEAILFPIGEIQKVESIVLVVELKRSQVAKLRTIKGENNLDETVDSIIHLIDNYEV